MITVLEVRTVKGMRRATTAVALTLWLSAPAVLLGQGTRSTGPNADTPRLLVAVFTSKDLPSGVQTADAIRNRVSNTANVRTLYVIPKEQIVSYLESSGYKPDSSLGASDLKELAKLLRADEVLGGTVTRTAAGYRIEPRLMLARDPAMAQPLPPIESNNTGDAARQIERSLQEARKQIADNRACENAIRDNKHAVAIAAANAGIAKYPQATIARLCLANAFSAMKAPPDSILRVTREIRQLDPRNSMARRYAYTAHKAKGDNESAVRVLVELFGLEPNDPSLQSQVITELAQLGKPDVAIPIVEELIAKNPGDPQLLRQKWRRSIPCSATAFISVVRSRRHRSPARRRAPSSSPPRPRRNIPTAPSSGCSRATRNARRASCRWPKSPFVARCRSTRSIPTATCSSRRSISTSAVRIPRSPLRAAP
jgi:tetratricopeptide (TPR) repeat protein